jgi:hypothetical protein
VLLNIKLLSGVQDMHAVALLQVKQPKGHTVQLPSVYVIDPALHLQVKSDNDKIKSILESHILHFPFEFYYKHPFFVIETQFNPFSL